ncbi:F-box/FBD/LRR-repeat protein At5g22660-like isoform X1 [Trifolium pratense]|uniref:F-box/FBD/LRR-repeat protein At5g22660-like isoform X1 n=1 Tax=Trifolium pratense TaxID=57577 RepID=UPI001E6968D8|nr:F-box/FBD/LRR-repeat protein At5g22660-like isoform X1 [Trifolium pratense]
MFEKKKKIEEISSSMVSNNASIKRHKHMISDLPNNVLVHILSFLSTKDAIKTSILSTKWRYLWTYLSVFDFRFFYYQKNRNPSHSLLDVVATLLEKSKDHLIEIKRITVRIPQVTLNADKVTFLVTSLLSLKVQDLEFSIEDLRYLNARRELPLGFSGSYLLSKLTLNLTGYTLNISNAIQFPSLKTLNLKYATFPNEESVEEFFSGCPRLEELTLINCYWLHIQKLTIAISTLRKLTIHFNHYCLQHCDDFDKFSVKIDAVNLLSLTCTSDPTIQFVIVNPPTSMLDAYIAFSLHFPWDDRTHALYEEYLSRCAVVLLSGLASVKYLTLSNDTFQESPYVNDRFHLLPKFHNLTHLCLDSDICSFSRTSFTKFLLKCPKLEVLVFPLGSGILRQDDNHGWKSIPVPRCIKSSLKKLHITDFCGYSWDIQFVEFFLENATVLEKFQISLSCSPLSKYNWKNLADLKNQFVGMGSCDIKFRLAKSVSKMQNFCKKCYGF